MSHVQNYSYAVRCSGVTKVNKELSVSHHFQPSKRLRSELARISSEDREQRVRRGVVLGAVYRERVVDW